ncbi:thiol:disulfide interchange protein DsbA/DsbL [Alteromonas sediminis]|nr:thiol:disulfide interchange protein DsbA/DsbL [Alteromonas sediminis]
MSLSVQAQSFQPGKHYLEVEGFQSQGKSITEFFSFYCPACFKQEAIIKMIKDDLPRDVTFVRNHIDGMPGRDGNIEHMLTKASIVAAHIGKEDEIIDQIFKHIHVSRADFTSLDDIEAIFVQSGIDSRDFLRTYNSFGITAKAKQKQQNNQKLVNQGISSVPTLVINGKYKPVLSDIKTVEEYKSLVMYLLNKPA